MLKKIFVFLSYWVRLENHKIKNKLLLTYPPLIAVSILLVSAYSTIIGMNLMKEKTIAYMQNIMQHVSRNIDIQLQRIDQDSLLFFQNNEIYRFFTYDKPINTSDYFELRFNTETFLTNFLISHPNIESIYLISRDDRIVETVVGGLNSNDIALFKEAASKGSGKTIWLKTITSKQGNQVIPVVREINDFKTIKPIGTIVMYFRENNLSNMLYDQDLTIKGEIKVIDSQGNVISGIKSEETPIRDIGLMEKIDNNTFFDKQTNYYYTYYISDYTNWTYLYRVPQSGLFHSIDTIRNWVMVFAFTFMIVAIVSANAIANNISKRIIRIVREMKQAELNKLSVNVSSDGNDELTYLAHSFNQMMQQLREMIIKETELHRMQHELEMRALQAEINPHFLYNTLEAINWMGRKNNMNEICEMTSMLADIMRYSIDKRKGLVKLSQEVEHIKKYLGIQKIRFRDNLSVFIDLPKSIMDTNIPKLTLQPIVENAIIHGLADKLEPGIIRMTGEVNNCVITLHIEDNGCGMNDELIHQMLFQQNTAKGKSIGLTNVNKRIQLFFGDRYGLDIFSVAGKGTRVTVRLPLQIEE